MRDSRADTAAHAVVLFIVFGLGLILGADWGATSVVHDTCIEQPVAGEEGGDRG